MSIKYLNSPDPKNELKPNDISTNAPSNLLNDQERGSDDTLSFQEEDIQPIVTQTDFGLENLQKQIVTNNPDEKDEIF